MYFRKKPVVIYAEQFDPGPSGRVVPALLQLADFNPSADDALVVADDKGNRLTVPPLCAAVRTLEGLMLARPGDWIIRGVKGEIYPCAPDIFAQTYEPTGFDGATQP